MLKAGSLVVIGLGRCEKWEFDIIINKFVIFSQITLFVKYFFATISTIEMLKVKLCY